MFIKLLIYSCIIQLFFFDTFARELSTPFLEKHIIFCQKDINETTKIASDFLKRKLSLNNKKERGSIINVYSEGLLKKYTNSILQKHKSQMNKEKSKKTKRNNNRTKHFFYVMVETEEVNKADTIGIYPDIKTSTKEYEHLKQVVINKLENEGYTISNNKNDARYILSIKIEDILKINAP